MKNKSTHYEFTNRLFIKSYMRGNDGLSIGYQSTLICPICKNNYIFCEHMYNEEKKIIPIVTKMNILDISAVKEPRKKGCRIEKLYLPIKKVSLNDIRKYSPKKVYHEGKPDKTYASGYAFTWDKDQIIKNF